MRKDKDVVVVGGGIAGLTAAAYLARGGARVRLFEKGRLGGRAQTEEREGFSLNLGPHALYGNGPAEEVLSELGVSVSGGSHGSSGLFGVKEGALRTLPAGFLSLLTTDLVELGAKPEVARLIRRLLKMDPAPYHGVTVAEWLRTELRHSSVRALAEALFRVSTYANAPERQSAGAALAQLRSAFESPVRYLDGGWQTLVDGLRAAAEAAGAHIEIGAVHGIERDGEGRVAAVVLDGGVRVACDAAILAASPKAAVALAPEATSVRAAAQRATPVRAACLDLALSRLPRPKRVFALGIDRPLYFSVHSAVARLAPEGGALVHVAKYLGDEPAGDAAELEELADLVQPGWREVLVHRRFLPRLTVAHALVTAEGGGLAGRPGVAVPEVKGLFLAGDWVGPTGMLADASFASARQAAREALARVVPAYREAA